MEVWLGRRQNTNWPQGLWKAVAQLKACQAEPAPSTLRTS